jgi:hypothetical protein
MGMFPDSPKPQTRKGVFQQPHQAQEEKMKATPTKETYLNSRTLQPPPLRGPGFWFIDKMDFQYLVLGIRFIPIPWTITPPRD